MPRTCGVTTCKSPRGENGMLCVDHWFRVDVQVQAFVFGFYDPEKPKSLESLAAIRLAVDSIQDGRRR